MSNNLTFNRISDLTGENGIIGVNLAGSVKLRDSLVILKNITSKGVFKLNTGTTVNDISTDGTFTDNSDNSLVTEKAIKTYIDTAISVEDLWDRDSTNGYTYLKNSTDKLGIGTITPDDQLTVSGGEAESGVINIWSDDGDDNADKWRLTAVSGGNLELQSYSTGSWVALASYRTDGRLAGGCIKDEDDMSSNSAAHVATQQSIKAYVDYTRYIRHIMNVGWNASNSNKDYLPLTGYIIERDSTSSSNEYIAFVAPYDGLLDKVVVRSESACGSSVVGFHKSDEGTEVPSSTATEEITVDMTTDDTGYTFTFTGTASFDKGDIITISFDPTNAPYDTVATIVWKFDTST